MNKIISILFILITLQSSAQQDEQMSIYMYNPLYFNPAYAGSKDQISMVAVGRFQWINFQGAPSSQWFSIHSPLLQKSLGVGAHLVNDRIGRRTRTSVYADVSGSIQLNERKQSRLAGGLSVGIDVMGYDFSDMIVNDVQDPFQNQIVSTTQPNVGAGLFYHSQKHYVGISSPRIMETRLDNSLSEPILLTARHFFLSAGYVLDINSVFKLKPSALVKYTANSPLTADLNISLLSYEKIWTGLMYRYHEAIGANIAFSLKDFTFGYVYDFPINGLMNYQSGSHELFLQYELKTKKSTYSSPRYF